MKKHIILVVAVMMLTACGKRQKPVQHVRVAVDSTAAEREYAKPDTSWQDDEGAIMIPSGELSEDGGDISEQELEHIFAGGDIGEY